MNSAYSSARSYLYSFCLLLSLVVTSIAQEKNADPHLGTWRLLSTKYGEATEATDYTGNSSMRLKIINATHFTWVEVEKASKKVLASAGGKYSKAGDTYTETIDFAGEGMEPFVGKPQKFTLRIEGDKLYQSGELSNGLKIEEVWERVK